MIRHQLPVYSPISLGAIAAAFRTRTGEEGGSRSRLSSLLARDYAADDVVLTGSGTQALQLAIEAALAMVGRDSVVALPAFSCFDVVSAAVGAGCRVTFYDLDPATLAPEQDSLERAFREGARSAVIAVLYGVPVPWDELEAIAAGHGALLIEDAAQGHGAAWRGQRLGSLGRISVLSFGRGKGWTGGGGGALLLRGGVPKPERALNPAGSGARVLLSTSVQWALGRPSLYGLPRMLPGLRLGETVYHPPVAPREMPERAAALLLATREAAEAEAGVRRSRGRQFQAELSGMNGLEFPRLPAGSTPGYLRFPVRVLRPNALAVLSLCAPSGLAPSYPIVLAELPELGPSHLRGTVRPDIAGAQALVRSLATLPVHSWVSEAERQDLLDMFRAKSPLPLLRSGVGR